MQVTHMSERLMTTMVLRNVPGRSLGGGFVDVQVIDGDLGLYCCDMLMM